MTIIPDTGIFSNPFNIPLSKWRKKNTVEFINMDWTDKKLGEPRIFIDETP